jgi:hypothetical protein
MLALANLLTTCRLCLQSLADKIVAKMKVKEESNYYNGLHMRMEKDAADWAIIMGGRHRLWTMYKDSMQKAGLDSETPLYVASGLLKASADDAWSRDEMQRLTQDILESKVCVCAVYRQLSQYVMRFTSAAPVVPADMSLPSALLAYTSNDAVHSSIVRMQVKLCNW